MERALFPYMIHPTQSGKAGMTVKELWWGPIKEPSMPLPTPYGISTTQRYGRSPPSWPSKKESKHGSIALNGKPKEARSYGAGNTLKVLPMPFN